MVRFATKNDLEKVNKLRRQVSDLHSKNRPDVFKKEFGKELQNIVFDCFQKNDNFIVVCEKDGEITGFAMLEIIKKEESLYSLSRTFLRVVELGTDESHRRQGVATEIFDFIKNFAKEKGFEKIELDMWEFNESALKFYEAMGFKTYRRYMDFDF